MLAIRIGEEIIRFRRIVQTLLIDLLDVSAGRGVLELHVVLRIAVDVLDELVQVFVPNVRVGPLKVGPKRMEEDISFVVVCLRFEVVDQGLRFRDDIVTI